MAYTVIRSHGGPKGAKGDQPTALDSQVGVEQVG